jgi:multidrug transporter EmrE-like cation transporter
MQSWIPFLWWLIIFEILADIGAKQFELSHSRYWYLWALLCYVWGNALWLFAMKNGVGLGRGTILFAVLSTVSTLLIAYWYYKEPISMVNIIGIGVCMIGLILLEWE